MGLLPHGPLLERVFPRNLRRLAGQRQQSRLGAQRNPPQLRRRRKALLNKMPSVSYTSREQIEVYRFSWLVTIVVPLLAIFFQAFIPLRFPFFSIFDLPLLVVIFFAMARRSPVTGLLTGAAIGLLQDSLTRQPIGLYGIAKTFVGYGASSLGVKLDVESIGTRLIVTTGFYVIHEVIYF